jgi:hypothetical protein
VPVGLEERQTLEYQDPAERRFHRSLDVADALLRHRAVGWVRSVESFASDAAAPLGVSSQLVEWRAGHRE